MGSRTISTLTRYSGPRHSGDSRGVTAPAVAPISRKAKCTDEDTTIEIARQALSGAPWACPGR